jgi:hypothetical protein
VTGVGVLLATARFAAFESAVFTAAARLARPFGPDRWLALLAFDVAIESTLAGALSFAHLNSPAAYWILAIALAFYGRWPDLKWPRWSWTAAAMAALATPLILLAFRPVDEIDSVNYLHYLIEWMANRATPYSFATWYVAFWELSFLPTWTVTGVDLFFPILALKGLAILAAAAWLFGRELDVPRPVLAWTIFGALTMRHYWLEYSGVATLKNDALHGAGFVILLVVVARAARGPLTRFDIALFSFGLAFSCVKYSGIFTGGAAAAIVVWLARDKRLLWSVPVVLLTSGHYYLRTLIQFGNPFYPFDLRLGPLHLRGEADLSYTSILHNLPNPRLWRLLFWPEGGVSPAGVLFPLILAGILICAVWKRSWISALILCGWLVYFRSVYSASAGPAGDLAFLGNGLNSLRYVDGVLAASEIFLSGLLGRFALPFIAVNTASRLVLLYVRVPFPAWMVVAVAVGVVLVCESFRRLDNRSLTVDEYGPNRAATVKGHWWGRRFRLPGFQRRPRGRWQTKPSAPPIASMAVTALLLTTPFVVERNRVRWTPYWNDLKPQLDALRGPDLAAFAMDEGSYFAGHVVAAGNPVHPEVRALLPEDLDAGARPRYLAVLVTPGFDWHPHYAARLAAWGYRTRVETPTGAILERNPPQSR